MSSKNLTVCLVSGWVSSFKVISTLMCLNVFVKVPLGPLMVIVLALTAAVTKIGLMICMVLFTVFGDIDSIGLDYEFHF